MIWIVPLLILLFPVELFDLPVPARVPHVAATVKAATKPANPAGKNKFPLKDTAKFDRKAFLLNFERQAGDQLIGCLRGNVGEKGHVSFVARLNQAGQLTGVRLLEAKQSSLECAVAAVRAMTFSEVTKKLDSDVEIAWRFDW